MNNLSTFLDFLELFWKKDSNIFETLVISNTWQFREFSNPKQLCLDVKFSSEIAGPPFPVQ